MHAPTENKVAPDKITIDGKKYDRARYEDPTNPGHTLPCRTYSSQELRACGLWGLVSPSGFQIASLLPREVQRDPSIVKRADAPVQLRADANQEWTKLYAIHARGAAALERRRKAEAARHRAFENRDKQAVTQAESDYKQAEQDRRDIELEEGPVKRALSEAEWKIKRWVWDETLRRQGRA